MGSLAIQIPSILSCLSVCLAAGALGAAAVTELRGRGRRAQMPLAVIALVFGLASLVAMAFRFHSVLRMFGMFAQIGTPIAQTLIASLVLALAALVAVVLLAQGHGLGRPLAAVALVVAVLAPVAAGRQLGTSSHATAEQVALCAYSLALAVQLAGLLAWALLAAGSVGGVGSSSSASSSGGSGGKPAAGGKAAKARDAWAKVGLAGSALVGVTYIAWVVVRLTGKTSSIGGYLDPTQVGKASTQASEATFANTVLTGDLALAFWLGAVAVGCLVPLAVGVLAAVARKRAAKGDSGALAEGGAVANSGAPAKDGAVAKAADSQTPSRIGSALVSAAVCLLCSLGGSVAFQSVVVLSQMIGKVSLFS